MVHKPSTSSLASQGYPPEQRNQPMPHLLPPKTFGQFRKAEGMNNGGPENLANRPENLALSDVSMANLQTMNSMLGVPNGLNMNMNVTENTMERNSGMNNMNLNLDLSNMSSNGQNVNPMMNHMGMNLDDDWYD